MLVGQAHDLTHCQPAVLIPANVPPDGVPGDVKGVCDVSHSHPHCVATENIFYICHKFVVLVSPSARTETKTTKKSPARIFSDRGHFYSAVLGSRFSAAVGQASSALGGLARAIFPPALRYVVLAQDIGL